MYRSFIVPLAKVVIICSALVLSNNAFSHGNHGIEEYDHASEISDHITTLLKSSELAGHSHEKYAEAKKLIKKQLRSERHNPALWYQWARVLQHDHAFEESLEALDWSLSLNKNSAAAWLLKANLHLTLAQYEQANTACAQLLGKASPLILVTCKAEVESYTHSPELALKKIQNALASFSLVDDITGIWVTQVAAELALRSNQESTAATLLARYPLTSVPVSYLLLWADTQQALGNHQVVLQQLTPIVSQLDHVADALLVRLALAEQNQNNGYWLTQLEQRMDQRVRDEDDHHAGELARYYLYISSNYERALHWAEVNYSRSKLASDKELLELATIKLNRES